MNHRIPFEMLTRFPTLRCSWTTLLPLIFLPRLQRPITRTLHWLTILSAISTLSMAAPQPDRLLNLSSRAWVGDGANVLIAGFVISDGPAKPVLVRAVGPTLSGFGVGDAVINPTLEIVDANNNVVASNQTWSSELAPTFDEVGAFGLLANSSDAALTATLAPGTYTAVVRTAPNTAYGTALVEVYDVSGPARLTNLSTRARVESNQTLVISGFVVAPGAGNRRLLLRAVGPTLQNFGVPNALSDPVMALVRQSDQVQIATNDNWGSTGDSSALSDTFSAAGAFALNEGSADAALVANLAPGAYTLMVSGAGGAAGPALIEVYDLTEEVSGPVITVSATKASTDTAPGSTPGQITVSRTGATDQPLSVTLSVSGTARAGTDYVRLPTSVTIPAGQTATTVSVIPYPNSEVGSFSREVLVSVAPGTGYAADSSTAARVTIFYESGTLYFANLAPQSSASNGYGNVTLKLASDASSLTISTRFANLSSPITAAYLRLGDPSTNGTLLVRLPSGTTTNTQWNISQVGQHSPSDILSALREGRLFVTVDTVNSPGGELTGTALRYDASAGFTVPKTPADAPTAPTSRADAARFLTQATFGPRRAAIDQLLNQSFAQWIDTQLSTPASLHHTETKNQTTLNPLNDPELPPDFVDRFHRLGAWWQIALQGNDQLRQRMAFALSQILVISDIPDNIEDNQEAVSRYYDVLVRHALGNYRDLLEEVTLHPLMGLYLSHLQNAKANPTTGSVPDENYAREIMQLFTIGLVELHPDGTLKLDDNGLPIPTYNQTTITETARVFTGWGFNDPDAPDDEFYLVDDIYDRPMRAYPSFHDTGAKTIVTGRVLPAGQGAPQDLRDTIDTLINHPNTGPFLARRLIQRLVTSNPSPGYIYRVAQVYADNGRGQRGDLGAMARAILLDPEARDANIASLPSFGKVKEPLLRVTALMRGLDAQLANNRLSFSDGDNVFGQRPLGAQSVFNFFRPDYVPLGDLAAAGLVAPEMQITDDTTAIMVPNHLSTVTFSNVTDPQERIDESIPLLDISALTPLWNDPGRLIDELNVLLCAGSLSDASRTRLLQAANQLAGQTDAVHGVSSLIYLVATSPDAAVQK